MKTKTFSSFILFLFLVLFLSTFFSLISQSPFIQHLQARPLAGRWKTVTCTYTNGELTGINCTGKGTMWCECSPFN